MHVFSTRLNPGAGDITAHINKGNLFLFHAPQHRRKVHNVERPKLLHVYNR